MNRKYLATYLYKQATFFWWIFSTTINELHHDLFKCMFSSTLPWPDVSGFFFNITFQLDFHKLLFGTKETLDRRFDIKEVPDKLLISFQIIAEIRTHQKSRITIVFCFIIVISISYSVHSFECEFIVWNWPTIHI